ncbi:MAG: hypothetical protein Q9181_006755 [Wetmoreana brouardii]
MIQLSDVQEIDGLEVDQTASGLQVTSNNQEPELVPAESLARIGLQTLPGVEKELPNITEKEPAQRSNESSDTGRSRHAPPATLKSKLWRYILGGVILILITVAFAVPLGVRTKHSERNKASSPTPGPSATPGSSAPPGSSADHPPTLPTQNVSGITDGTSITIMPYDDSNVTNISLFYQDSQSRLRLLEKIGLSPFTSGSNLPIVGLDARERTPITYMNYSASTFASGISLFYVDSKNVLQQQTSEDGMATWHKGYLGSSHFVASASATALSTNRAVKNSDDSNARMLEMPRIFYGAPDNLLHEIIYTPGGGGWVSTNFTFTNTNGNAGHEAAWIEYERALYLFVVNTTNFLKVWSLDLNTTSIEFPYGLWSEEPVSGPGPEKLAVNSSLTWAYYSQPGSVCYQTVSSSIECTDWFFNRTREVYPLPLESPSFEVGYYNPDHVQPSFFFQTNSSDLTQNIKDIDGNWQATDLPT